MWDERYSWDDPKERGRQMKSVGVSEGKQHTLRPIVPVCSRAWIDNLSKSPMQAGWKEKRKV